MGQGVAQAARVVGRARSRLAAASLLRAASTGGLVGACAGIAAAVVAQRVSGSVAPGWLIALPAAGAAAGALWSLRTPTRLDHAALALDRAAATDEAFVTALTEPVGGEGPFRELAAEYALERCDERSVPRMLPIPTPATAGAASLATCALAALLFAAPREDGWGTAPRESPQRTAGAGSSPSPGPTVRGDPTPADPSTLRRLTDAVRSGDAATQDRLVPEAARSTPAASDAELRELATALRDRGVSHADEVLAALDRGDAAAAVAALRRALGFGDAGPGADVAGGSLPGTASPPGDDAAAASQMPVAWPLRYDAAIRRWYQEKK